MCVRMYESSRISVGSWGTGGYIGMGNTPLGSVFETTNSPMLLLCIVDIINRKVQLSTSRNK